MDHISLWTALSKVGHRLGLLISKDLQFAHVNEPARSGGRVTRIGLSTKQRQVIASCSRTRATTTDPLFASVGIDDRLTIIAFCDDIISRLPVIGLNNKIELLFNSSVESRSSPFP